MTELYIEPFSGLSGDMLLSGLCGLADYYDEIVDLPAKLNLPDGKVVIDTVNKNGIVCKHVRIVDLNESKQQDHVHEHVAGHQHDHHHHHDHEHSDHQHEHDDHHHDHGHDHHHHQTHPDHHHEHADHHHYNHEHTHRHLKDILRIIDHAEISDKAKEIAKDIFTIIGKSESKIHHMDLDKIHFHEVSGVDSILDIVGCAVLIDRLEIAKTYSDPICTGFGMVKTQHGLLPVPAPATADILMSMPTYPGDEKGERVTPTGAAILKYLNPEFSVKEIRRDKIAYGPGKKDFVGPNVVRLSLLTSAKKKAKHHQHS
jgi:uncharacterized protein (DUF111 family)